MSKFITCLIAVSLFAADSPQHRTSLERLDSNRLEAVHAARMQWEKERSVQPPLGIYHDYRAVLHVHAQDAAHTLGTREQVLEAAKQTGVKVVMWSDHRGPLGETWSGFRDGVLFIPGSEDDDNKLRYPREGDELLFLSHIEEIPNKPSTGFQGMEIYNRHADAKVNKEFTDYLNAALKDAKEFSKLSAKQKKFPDEVFAAGTGPLPDYIARFDQEIASHRFTGIAANDAHRNVVLNSVVFDPYEVSFRNVSTHILARELKEDQIRSSLRNGHAYVSHDWLCDPTGFALAASNNLGLFTMGDRVPMLPNTPINARFPIAAHARLYHNGKVVHESTAAQFSYTPTEPGAYRLEAWLGVDGEERPWIYSNPLYFYKPSPDELKLPSSALGEHVKAIRDVAYADDDLAKHKLDIYLPVGKTNFPVLFFVHGGSWRTGDRSQYPALANRLVKAGMAVVVPSYRLQPQAAAPAQIEDVAAAFAWTVKHIAEQGGDPKRIYIAGHSAGGHLVAELAVDPRWLEKYELAPASIQGVAAFSGVYDVSKIKGFERQYSPMEYVSKKAPRFLVSYCEHDYAGLGMQAVAFDAALRKAFAESTLLYLPGENHISEIVNVWKEDDPVARAMIGLVFEHSN